MPDTESPQKGPSIGSGRPGQRQQERQQRLARRRRRQRLIITAIAGIVLVASASVALWQYNRYLSDQTALANQQATATVGTQQANETATVTADGATQTAVVQPTFDARTATATILIQTPTPVPPTPTPPSDKPPTIDKEPVTTESGLKYIDIEEGVGLPAGPGSSVTVIYTGWVESTGQKFGSTFEDSQPYQFTLGVQQVIPGWDEGLVGVKSGSVRRLIIPPDLAYGDQARTDQNGKEIIPANSTLIFDITVISVR